MDEQIVPKKTLKEKVLDLIGSARFWQITMAAGAVLAAHYIPDLEFFFHTLATWLAAVAGIGTLDSVAERFSGIKG
jgi:hypothetical protein